MKIETLETISEEFEQNKEIEQGKPMFTINKDLVVVETTETWSNPLSSNRDMMKLFLEHNRETLENYFNSDDNYGISFYECGYNGKAQDEFIQGWLDNGVKVF